MNMKDSAVIPHSHLSDDELDEILIGIATDDASAHLAHCTSCGQRLAAFQSQLDAFNHATMAWSEARANSISRDLLAHKLTPRVTLKAAWSSAAVAVLALAFAVGGRHYASETAPMETAQAPSAASSPDDVRQHEIDSDNAMLAAIDDEIVTPQPDRFGLYEPAKASTHVSQSIPEQARD